MTFRQRTQGIINGMIHSIRNNLSQSLIALYALLNMGVVGLHFPARGIILLASLALLLLVLFRRDDWRWLAHFRRGWLGFSLSSWAENAHTLATYAALLFFLSMLAVNIGWIWPGRWLMLGVIVLGVLSACLLLVALIRNDDRRLKKRGYLLGLAVPLIYAVTSSYAASNFFIMSGIKLEDSPVLNLWVKALYFSVWFALIMYPATSILYKLEIAGSNPRRLVTLSVFFFIIVMIIHSLTQWFGKLLVEIQDYAIDREWQRSYYCAGAERHQAQERYFAIDEQNWALYYSGREGKWGFERLHCETGINGEPEAKRRPLEGPHPMPQWFK